MGVHLDWEILSIEGESDLGEDPLAGEIRQRSTRVVVIRLGIALAVVLILIAAAAWRLREVDQQRRALLEATIDAETLALRIGDRAAYMRAQARETGWRDTQHDTFAMYQTLSPRVMIPGTLGELEISGDEARAVLPVEVDGVPYESVWLYEYTDRGWRHVASAQDPWIQEVRQHSYFTVVYFRQDELQVDRTLVLFSQWWRRVLEVTGRSPGRLQITIQIMPDPHAPIRWTDEAQTVLQIPSRPLGDYRNAGLQPDEISQVTSLLAERWADLLLSEVGSFSYERWVRNELAALVQDQLDPYAPEAAILSPLRQTFGFLFIDSFLRDLEQGRLGAQALHSAMTRHSPGVPAGLPQKRYLEDVLQAETALRAWESDHSMAIRIDWQWQSNLAFLDLEHRPNLNPTYTALAQPYIFAHADPATIEVRDVETYGALTWVEVAFSTRPIGAMGEELDVVARVPFREMDGLLMHSAAQAQDWGARIETREGSVRLIYYHLDAPFVTGLAPDLAAMRDKIAADFGIDEPPPAVVDILPDFIPYYSGSPSATVDAVIFSPHIDCCLRGETPEQYLRERGAHYLIRELLAYRMDHPLSGVAMRAVEHGLIQWEAQRIGFGYRQPRIPANLADLNAPKTPQQVWERLIAPPSELSTPQDEVSLLAGETLVEVVVERYGIESLGALIEALPQSASLHDWLARSVEGNSGAIRGAWEARFAQALREARP